MLDTQVKKTLRRLWPSLQRFPHVHIRHTFEYPFGGVYQNLEAIDRREWQPLPDSNSIYSRIGLLAYNGCSTKQIGRIGDLLQQITSEGGLPALGSRTARTKRVQKVHIDLTKTAQRPHEFAMPMRQIINRAQLRAIVNDLFKDEPGTTEIEAGSCIIPKPFTIREGFGYKRTLAINVWVEKVGEKQEHTGPKVDLYSVKLYTVGTERFIGSAHITRTAAPTNQTDDLLTSTPSLEKEEVAMANRRKEVVDRFYALERECLGDELLRELNEHTRGPRPDEDGDLIERRGPRSGKFKHKKARSKKRTGSHQDEAEMASDVKRQSEDLSRRDGEDEHKDKIIVDA